MDSWDGCRLVESSPDEIRIHNLPIVSQTPSPPGHTIFIYHSLKAIKYNLIQVNESIRGCPLLNFVTFSYIDLAQ